MADYLTNTTELTSVADAIRTKGGTSAALEYPTEFISAINAIETGGGSTGPITNPLQGATIDAASTYTYQYEFDSTYGNPSAVYLTTLVPGGWYDWGTGTNTGPRIVSGKVTADTTGLLTVNTMSGGITANAHYVCIVSFVWGTFKKPTMTACDAFLLGYIEDICYLKGTKITLADGTVKKVEHIRYADDLLVWDFDKSEYTSARPLWIKKPEKAEGYYHLEFAKGGTLDVVGSNGKAHRLLDLDGTTFESATDLVGHHISRIDGSDVLLSCTYVAEPCEYYNIITERHMNCYTNDILTSCRYNNIYPIHDMKFSKEDRAIVPIETYGVPKEFYDGMRLGEQIINPTDTVKYINRMIKRRQ